MVSSYTRNMNTVPHSETPITTRQSAITDLTADRAVAGASARASMGRRELLQHVGTFGLGAVSFGVLGLGITGCTPSAAEGAHGAAAGGSASGSASGDCDLVEPGSRSSCLDWPTDRPAR